MNTKRKIQTESFNKDKQSFYITDYKQKITTKTKHILYPKYIIISKHHILNQYIHHFHYLHYLHYLQYPL